MFPGPEAGRAPDRPRTPRGCAPERAPRSGGPSATTRPASSSTSRGKKCAARPRSWSTARIVVPSRSLRSTSRSIAPTWWRRSRWTVGSSSDEERRRLGDGQRDQHQLALAERQLAHVAPEEMADADPLDGCRDRGAVRGARSAEGVLVRQPPEPDDLLDPRRERRASPAAGRRQAAWPPRAGRGRRRASRRARRGRAAGTQQAARDPEQRRLAGTVRADERHALAGLDREVDPVEDVPAAIGDGHVGQPDDRRGHGRRRAHSS